jgi:hypothetical protein
MTDCIAVLPAAVTSMTVNNSATRARGRVAVTPPVTPGGGVSG